MLGHISGAYSAHVSRDLSLSSRFDFNMYSYESEWAMGAEWWMRRSPLATPETVDDSTSEPRLDIHSRDDVQGVVKARASTNNVRVSNLKRH
jgi:mitochondrial distribution and morphology protein 10